jgi:hypothetical protein
MVAAIALVCVTLSLPAAAPLQLASAPSTDVGGGPGAQARQDGEAAGGGHALLSGPPAVTSPLEEGPEAAPSAEAEAPADAAPTRAFTAWDIIHIVLQTSLVAAGAWVVASPVSAAVWLAASGVIPAGFAFIVLVPATPLLLLLPPLAVAGGAALAGWGQLTPAGVAALAGIGGGASMAAAFVIGPFVLWRLLTPPPPSERFNPGLLFRVTWTMAAGALWLVPAAAGGLAAGIAAPFFLKGPEEGAQEGAGGAGG